MLNSIGIFLIIALVYLGGVGTSKITSDIRNQEIEEDTSDIFDKQQIIKTKQDTDFTGSTQGDTIIHDSILENIEPDFIYYDTTEVKREEDSIDAYVKHWYEVLDTNGDGQIDEHVMWIGGDGDTIWE